MFIPYQYYHRFQQHICIKFTATELINIYITLLITLTFVIRTGKFTGLFCT